MTILFHPVRLCFGHKMEIVNKKKWNRFGFVFLFIFNALLLRASQNMSRYIEKQKKMFLVDCPEKSNTFIYILLKQLDILLYCHTFTQNQIILSNMKDPHKLFISFKNRNIEFPLFLFIYKLRYQYKNFFSYYYVFKSFVSRY